MKISHFVAAINGFIAGFLIVLLTKMFNEVHFILTGFMRMFSSLVVGLLTSLFTEVP